MSKTIYNKCNFDITVDSQVAASLTPEMVQLEQIRKWDGKLPTYSGASNTLLNIGQ